MMKMKIYLISLCLIVLGTRASAQTCTATCSAPNVVSFTTGVQNCFAGCNTGAAVGPNFPGNQCYDYPNATVWYSVTTLAGNATMSISITSGTLTNPYFTVFSTSDCNLYTVYNCTQGSGGSVSNTVNISSSTTYLIAVSDQNGAVGNFNFCITVNNDNSACNVDNDFTVTATSLGSPLNGPYQPGEVVTFHYAINQFKKINCNYLQAIIPTFGNCWDAASFNSQGMPNVSTALLQQGTREGRWAWWPSGVVLYNNISGSLPPNTPLPAGWYFLDMAQAGSSGDPDVTWGDGFCNGPCQCDVAGSGYTWVIEFQLIAGKYSNCSGGLSDCVVSIKTYADGEIGNWNNVGCTADIPAAAPSTTMSCTAPNIVISPSAPSICAGDSVTLTATVDLSQPTYPVSFSNNTSVAIPNNDAVTGANSNITVSGINPATLSSGMIASVCFTINHTRIEDIGNAGTVTDAITLTSPSGTSYNFTPLPTAPAGSGRYTACFPASTLNGITGNVNGTWTLHVEDNMNKTGGSTFTGSLLNWNIVFLTTNSYTFSWSPTTNMTSSTTLTPTVSPTTTTTYTLTVNEALGYSYNTPVTVTVNSAPTAPTASGTTICSGTTATLTATAPGGTYQWYDAAAGGTLLFTGAGYTTPSLGTATTYYIQTTLSGCTSTRTPVTVNINPALTVSNTTVTCSGDNTTYTVTFDINGGDAGSYSVTGGSGSLSGNTFTSNPIASGSSYSFTATDSYDCSPQTVSGSQNCSCAAAASVSGGGTTCSGTPASNIVFTLLGSSPWDLTYSINGTPQTPVTGIATSPYTISNPSAGTYTISSVSDGSCTGSGSGSASVTINNLPTATLSGGGSICADGSTDTVSIALTGTGPWSITYAINGTPQAPVTGINSSPYNIITSAAGTFSVTAVSDANCSGTFSGNATITVNPLPTPSIFPGDTAFCSGGSVTLTSTAAAFYLWSNSTTAQTINVSSSGTFNITVTDGSGCTNGATPVTVTVNSNPSPTISNTGPTTFCAGDSVLLSSSFANSYLWSTSATSQSIYALNNGTYTVTVTDVNGCTGTASRTITVNPNPTSTTSTTNENCGQGDGTATVSPGGGTSPYFYLWDVSAGNQNTATATGLSSGIYSVTIMDSNSCESTNSAIVASPGGPTATQSSTAATCGNCNGTSIITPSGGTSPYSYLWSNFETDSTATGLCGGAVSVTVTDNLGCAVIASLTISSTPAVNSVADSVDATCGQNNGQATAYPFGGTSPFTYLWNNGQTNDVATGLGAGIYIVTVTDANTCTATASTIVNAISPPTVSVSSTNVDCNGNNTGQATATPSSGTPSYSWSNSQTTQTITGLIAGTYYVTVTDANSCTVIDSAVIAQPQPLLATATPTNILCNGDGNGQASLAVSGGTTNYTFLWSNGQTTQTATGLSGGAIICTITDANGCTDTAQTSINEPSILSASTSQVDVLCNSANTGSVTANPSGGTSPYSYLWNNAQTGAADTALTAATYNVTITDANLCTATSSSVITQPGAIIVATDSTAANCGQPDGTATVTPFGGVSPYTYLWADGQTDSTATALSAADYIVTVTDANGCKKTTQITVANATGFSASASAFNATCFGFSDGEATVNPSGGTSPYSYVWDSNAGGQTDSIATGLAAGTYSVTVTDNAGCSFDALATVGQPNVLAVSLNPTNVTCSGDGNGQVATSVNGGTTNYSYLWSDAQTGSTATGLSGGNFTVTITDANGCAVVDSAAVSEPALLSVSANVSDIQCNGDGNGQVSTTVNGGTTNYSYLWSNGQTGASATGLNGGAYTVTITDANGCTDTVSATVDEPISPLSATVSNVGVSCNGGNDGSVTANALGGTSPYGYSWSNGCTSSTCSGLLANTYDVTITDANGCTFLTAETINEPSVLSIISDSMNVTCAGNADGTATASVSGGISPYSYLWSDNQTDSTATGLSGGTFSVTVTDANSCSAIQSVFVNEPVPLSSAPTSSDETCGQSNGSVSANIIGGTTPYSYSWTNGCTSPNCTGLTPGNYSVTITDNNGCTATGSATVGGTGAVTAVVSYNDISCNGGNDGSASVTASGGATPYSYLWSDAQITSTATGLSSGTFYVTVTDSTGCFAVDSAIVSEPSALIITPDSTDVICNGDTNGTATVNVSGGTTNYSYQWDTNAANQTTPTATGLSGGAFTVTVTDANGCTTSQTIIVNEPAAITVSISGTNAACGLNNGSVTANANGGTSPFNYLWSSGCISSNCTALAAGTYNVTITDNNGCSTSATTTITGSAGPTVTTSSTSVLCNGGSTGSATANAIGGATPYTYNWSSGGNSATENNLAAGTYFIMVTDSANCPATDSVIISEPSAISPNISSQTNVSCNGGNNGSATVSASGGTTNYSYVWSNGQISATATGLAAGNYSVTVTDVNGCTATAAATAIEPAVLTITPSAITACGDTVGSATAQVSGGTSTYTYSWTGGQTTSTATGLSPGNYSVTVTDANNCTKTGSVTIALAPIPTVSVREDTTVFQDTEVNISATAGGGGSPYTYLWNNGSTSASFSEIPSQTTTYSVTVTNSSNCSVVASVEIKVDPQYVIYIPTMFSPNGDGNNDLLYIRGLGIKEIDWIIFDRWGEKVFQTGNIVWTGDKTIFWDGKYKGKEMNSAVFVYILTGTLENGDIIDKKGNFTLVR